MKKFTLVDATSGYWQVRLDEESSKLTTFNTPWGKYKYLRLPFGLKVSSDMIQQRLEAVLKHLPCVTGITDNCLVAGKDEYDHDIDLLILLQAACLNHIKFKEKKI